MRENATTATIGDFRLTRTRSGLRIESLEYHAEAVEVDARTLRELGLLGADAGSDARTSRDRRWLRSVPLGESSH